MSKAAKKTRRRVLVVTGSRAEFGLLRPVMDAIGKRGSLELRVCVAGEHLLGPAQTWREVAKDYRIDAKVAMQRKGDRGRLDHAAATGRGVSGFAAAYGKIEPDWVVVLGDRIEAFAAASAASIAGIAVCHIHGGDRAEGIADEAMRHAITKMSHLHCAATEQSAKRIVRMGEKKECVHVTGSPAIDGLVAVKPMSDSAALRLGDPKYIVLQHPSALLPDEEARWAYHAVVAAREIEQRGRMPDRARIFERILLLAPNADPGREHIETALLDCVRSGATFLPHLPRPEFLSLLARLAAKGGALIGNSSAGLIEAAALRVPVLNQGPRQAGREHGSNVVHLPTLADPAASIALQKLRALIARGVSSKHPFGDGRAGEKVALVLEATAPGDLVRKRNAF